MSFVKKCLIFLSAFTPALSDQPKPWQIGFQEPASTKMVAIENMHHFLFFIIVGIAIVVGALMVFVMFRFSEKRHPTPSKTTHNIPLEIIWTLIPALIVAVIAVPSVKLIYEFDQSVTADLTLKITGHQWYWSYEYEGKNVAFDSYMIPENELKSGQIRNLDVDNRVVVPAGKIVKLHITSADVIHAFAVPSFGIQKNAVPGRVNETWFKVEKPGVYYGQCWAICGIKHGFMPIAIQVVPEKEFDAWIASKAEKPEAKKSEAKTPEAKTPEAKKIEGKPVSKSEVKTEVKKETSTLPASDSSMKSPSSPLSSLATHAHTHKKS